MKTVSLNYTGNEWISFRLMAISVYLGLFAQCFQNYVESFAIPLYLSILITGFGGLFVFLSGGGKKNVYTTSFLILFFYLSVIGLSGNHFIITIALVQDLRYVMYFLIGSIFAQNDRYMAYFHSVMKRIAYVAIILGVYAIITFPFESIEGREATWTDNYYFWWASASSFAYLGAYALVFHKDRFVGLGTFAIFFVLGMLFLKRSAFLNIIVIVILSIIIQRNKPLKHIFYTFIGVVVFLFVLQRIAPQYFFLTGDALYNRFDAIDNVSEVDRNVEAEIFFRKSSWGSLIFGYGIFNYPSGIVPGRPLNALHNGWTNIIFKGGLIYIIWYLWIYGRIIKNMFHIKHTQKLHRVCLVVALSSLISLIYEGSWTYTILPFCISAPIFYSARKFV